MINGFMWFHVDHTIDYLWLKNMSSSILMTIPNLWKNTTFSKPPTIIWIGNDWFGSMGFYRDSIRMGFYK